MRDLLWELADLLIRMVVILVVLGCGLVLAGLLRNWFLQHPWLTIIGGEIIINGGLWYIFSTTKRR